MDKDGGIPLTNGEAYAILRRNRDIRYAKALPPFGMQSRGTPANMSGAMQMPFNPAWRNPRGDSKAAQKEAAIRASADFMQQNAVGLNEVRGLFYLRPHAVGDYGVSSVYSSSFTPTTTTHHSAASSSEVDESHLTSSSGGFHAVPFFGAAGTNAHVVGVMGELDALDRVGRQAQLQTVKKLKSIVLSASPLVVTEAELRNLIDIRPQSEVMVSAVIPNLEDRFKLHQTSSSSSTASLLGVSEEAADEAAAAAASKFAQEVISVFQ